MIRVTIVEDDPATRQGYVRLLRHSPEIVCVGVSAAVDEAVAAIPKMNPDVVLMDINLGEGSGIDCVARLKRILPKVQVLMLTTYDDSDLIFDSLRAGASGYILKRATGQELVAAIQDVHGGGSPMSMQIARKVVSHFHRAAPKAPEEVLTPREEEILGLLAQGLLYKEIASRLNISPSTVHGHLHAIYGKLHVQSKTEAVIKFLRHRRDC